MRQYLRAQQPNHHCFLRVEAILGLVEHDRARTVDHLVGDFFAACAGRQCITNASFDA